MPEKRASVEPVAAGKAVGIGIALDINKWSPPYLAGAFLDSLAKAKQVPWLPRPVPGAPRCPVRSCV